MTISKKSRSSVNVGVDVGKDILDICIHEKALHWQEPNTLEGVRKLLKRLAHYHVERLVMEATGRYQLLLAEQAYERDIPVCIMKPRATLAKRKKLILIKDLLARRRQIMEMRTQELNRLQIMGKNTAASCKRVLNYLDKELARLEKQLDEQVETEEIWADKKALLKSAPGIGDTMVYTLVRAVQLRRYTRLIISPLERRDTVEHISFCAGEFAGFTRQ